MIKNILFGITLLLSIIPLHAKSVYHDYQTKMVAGLRNLFIESDSILFLDVPSNVYNDSPNLNDCGEPDLISLDNFVKISRALRGLSALDYAELYPDGRIIRYLTAKEVDEISDWWNENENFVDSLFIQDAVSYIQIGVYHKMFDDYNRDYVKSRMEERIKYRSRVKCPQDSSLKSDYMQSFIRTLQSIFNTDFNGNRIESVSLTSTWTFIVYATWKLMGKKKAYNSGIPFTRNDFEEIKDWLFVNGCDFEDDDFSLAGLSWWDNFGYEE